MEQGLESSKILLQVKDLKKYFPLHSGFFLKHTGDVKALDGVSFELPQGKTLGIVGESGCGKSTLGKTLIRLHEPTSGEIYFEGRPFHLLQKEELRQMRKRIQMIFQDPFSSLDPRMTVARILQEPLDIHQMGTMEERRHKVEELITQVGLKKIHLNRYPHEFSGGQRQRISIARSMALGPELIIADEPVSALDVSIQSQVLNLLKDLQAQLNLTMIFISHDLSVIEHMCDFIAVMYLGKIVELAPREELFSGPRHPYTQALMNAIPIPGRGKVKKRKILSGDVPSPINPPPGCAFHPRCEWRENVCSEKIPVLEALAVKNSSNHCVSCWVAQQAE